LILKVTNLVKHTVSNFTSIVFCPNSSPIDQFIALNL